MVWVRPLKVEQDLTTANIAHQLLTCWQVTMVQEKILHLNLTLQQLVSQLVGVSLNCSNLGILEEFWYCSFCALWIHLLAPSAAQMRNSVYYVLICSYMFWCSCHLQGAYTSVVETYSNKTVLQWSWISTVQVSVKIYVFKILLYNDSMICCCLQIVIKMVV